MSLQTLFEEAVSNSKTLPSKPSNEILLQLYALYKQVTEGDAQGDAPNMFDFVAKAKHEAWASLQGKSKDAAMQEYIDLVKKLQD